MEDPEYYIHWGNDEGYSRYPSEREGYAIQYCEFEKTIEKGVEVEEMLVDMQIGARFYKHDFDRNFVSLPENYFDLYMYHMDYTDEIEQLPIYEEEFHEVQNWASYPFDVEQVFAARIEKMENEEEE